MTKVTIVYIGMRLYGSAKSYCYENTETGNLVTFNKKLVSVEIVGTVIEADVDGTTYRACKIVRGSDSQDNWYPKVDGWFIANRAANESYQAVLDAKKFGEGPVDDLIKRFRDQCWGISRQEKIRIARYIFEQLIK